MESQLHYYKQIYKPFFSDFRGKVGFFPIQMASLNARIRLRILIFISIIPQYRISSKLIWFQSYILDFRTHTKQLSFCNFKGWEWISWRVEKPIIPHRPPTV